jgi:hypothetical protein
MKVASNLKIKSARRTYKVFEVYSYKKNTTSKNIWILTVCLICYTNVVKQIVMSCSSLDARKMQMSTKEFPNPVAKYEKHQ